MATASVLGGSIDVGSRFATSPRSARGTCACGRAKAGHPAHTEQSCAACRPTRAADGARAPASPRWCAPGLVEPCDRWIAAVEVDRHDLIDLPEIVARLSDGGALVSVLRRPVVEPSDASYKALKAALDGSLAGPGDNTLITRPRTGRKSDARIHARKTWMPRTTRRELHPGESTEEKCRCRAFRTWLSFYPFRQDDFLTSWTTGWRASASIRRGRAGAPGGAAVRAGARFPFGRVASNSRATTRAVPAWRAVTSTQVRTSCRRGRRGECAPIARCCWPTGPAGKPYAGYWEFPAAR